MTNIEYLTRYDKPYAEFVDAAGHPCDAYIDMLTGRLRLGRWPPGRGTLDLDAAGARAVAGLLLRWAETGRLEATDHADD